MNLCYSAGFNPNVKQEAADTYLIIGQVAANMGISLVPTSVQARELSIVNWMAHTDRDSHGLAT